MNSGYSSLVDGHLCASTVTEGQAVTFLSPTLYGLSWDTGTPTTNKATVATRVRGDGIPIWWQSSDAQVLARASALKPTAILTSVETLTSAMALPSSTLESPGVSQTSRPSSGGLSTAVGFGLGMGIPVAVMGGLVIVWLLWRRRRSFRADGRSIGKAMPAPSHEIDGYSRHEMPDMAHHWR
jgi:hypothetical protein